MKHAATTSSSDRNYPSCVGMMRPALHEVVADAMIAAGVRPRFGTTLSSLDEARGYDLIVRSELSLVRRHDAAGTARGGGGRDDRRRCQAALRHDAQLPG